MRNPLVMPGFSPRHARPEDGSQPGFFVISGLTGNLDVGASGFPRPEMGGPRIARPILDGRKPFFAKQPQKNKRQIADNQ